MNWLDKLRDLNHTLKCDVISYRLRVNILPWKNCFFVFIIFSYAIYLVFFKDNITIE